MKQRKQRTLASAVFLEGVGLHSGADVKIACRPAETDTGFMLKRVDLPGSPAFPATVASLKEDAMQRQTSLTGENCAQVSTVEHLLSACCGLNIDNLLIEVDGPELPMFDGSAEPIVSALLRGKIVKQDARIEPVGFDEAITFKEDDAELTYLPGEEFRATFFADFNSDVIGTQAFHFTPDTDYSTEVAPARTFVFDYEIEYLRKNNLIKGGSLKNALVITDTGYMNGPLRFDNEIARHKLLDLLGDLMLLGRRLRGHVLANKSGHRSHVSFVKLLSEKLRVQ